jgi:hypothetical protein
MILRKREETEVARVSNRAPSLETLQWQRLWTQDSLHDEDDDDGDGGGAIR